MAEVEKMSSIRPCDLQSVRKSLGKTQEEFSQLLGLSIRALQSYEQGWREVPVHVQKLAAMILYLDWRKENGRPEPCWKVRKCSREAKSHCNVNQFKAADVCWMVGTECPAEGDEDAKFRTQCCKCTVLRKVLSNASA
jgi:DNA-binding XRE family transcriptional regulator